MKTYCVAVAGATGAVGTEMIRILEERSFPVKSLVLLASRRSAGRTLPFRGSEIRVRALTRRSFSGVDIAFFSAGAERSLTFAPAAVRAGAVVIDNSSAFRMRPDVPLVVPEVNPNDIFTHKGIIANPNCTTIIMLMGIYPLRGYGIRRVVAASYQAVSGAGAGAMEELKRQTLEWALHELRLRALGEAAPPVLQPERFPHPIAFNLIPQIGEFLESGYTKEEMKCLDETRKILHDPEMRVTATTVRVPVMRSHSIAVHIELERRLSPSKARALIRKAEGVTVCDQPGRGRYPMPVTTSGSDECVVGRIRTDYTVSNGLAMWIVGDQLRKGAALNAVQIAERLVRGRD